MSESGSSSDESQIDEEVIPKRIQNAAEKAVRGLIPEKSGDTYRKNFSELTTWMEKNKTKSFNETVLLAYFHELSMKIAPSSLWSKYSMIRKVLYTEKNIDIKGYSKLQAFLKVKNSGFLASKAKTFTSEEIKEFLKNAPNDKFLAVKVALIMGVQGACRREELYNMKIGDIQDKNTHLIINIPVTKTKITRTFTIDDPLRSIVLQYLELRPKDIVIQNVFLTYRNGKCINQVIGINSLAAMPKTIATWLNLRDVQMYKGHSFRRTSATLLADAGATITDVKRHGGWRSTAIAEGYIENSINNKRKIGNRISDTIITTDEDSNTLESPNKQIKISINKNDATATGDAQSVIININL